MYSIQRTYIQPRSYVSQNSVSGYMSCTAPLADFFLHYRLLVRIRFCRGRAKEPCISDPDPEPISVGAHQAAGQK